MVADLDAAHEEIAVEVDGVADLHGQPERRRAGRHARDERHLLVVELLLPDRAVDPGEGAVAPDAKPRTVADRLIVLPDVRVIDIADVVVIIEVDHDVAVGERQIARHRVQNNSARES